MVQPLFAFFASLFGSDRVRNRELGSKGIVEALFEDFDSFVSFLESIKRVSQKLNQLGMRELLELRCVFLVGCSVHPAVIAEFAGDFSPSFHTMDSYGATALLRARDYRGTIIALTAHAMESDRNKCIQAGCDGYSTKPIEKEKLFQHIKYHCDSSFQKLMS